ncbi:MAG TPA: molecular chaperone TorD family protein [Usitatibacter sp.]|nr:molecular chaperone TorD family protein [Usitatibacter sp.]
MSAQTAAAPLAFHRTLPPEEAARGHFYALLARMLNAPPDAGLLRDIASAPPLDPDGDAALAQAWNSLVAAASVMDAEAAAEEHDALFAAPGKAPVSLYAGFYMGATAVEHPRVRVRADLAALGLAPRSTEPEDHLGGILEAMRVLVAGGGGRGPAPLAEQRRFFEAYVAPAAGPFFEALGAAEPSNFYRRVAAVGAAFVALEAESFSLD